MCFSYTVGIVLGWVVSSLTGYSRQLEANMYYVTVSELPRPDPVRQNWPTSLSKLDSCLN